MKIKQKAGEIQLKKEQLLSEKSFIRYCVYDYHNNRKLEVNEAFLRAAEADGFLRPLLQAEEDVTSDDGSQKKTTVNYYSPHQIYIVAALSKNQVHEGLLWADTDLEFYKQQGFRMVNWGLSSAFNITLSQKNKALRIVNQMQLGNGTIITVEQEGKNGKNQDFDHVLVCNDFQNFLILLHSFEQLRYSPDQTKGRHFSEAPSLYFDLSPLKIDGDKILEKYGLDLEKLKIIQNNIARFAISIDPLEHWYYYIHRHPQWRKDLFKGEALLAQELYVICDLLLDAIEAVSGEKQKPMFEMLYGEKNIYPYLIPRAEYVHGTDVNSLWEAIKKFKDWMKEDDNKDFVEDGTLSRLENFKKELKEYEDKYGKRSFTSYGVREVEVEKNIKIEDLDSKTRHYVEDMIRQAKAQLVESNRQFLSLWDDELEEKVKKKEITLEQAKKEDYDFFVKREIFDAIEQRLSSLKRELWEILDEVQKKITKNVNKAWDIEHNFGNHFWFQHKGELDNLSREKQHEMYQIEYKKSYEEAQYWSKKRDEFDDVIFVMELLFCSVCREKPIAIHQSHNDEKVSNKAICDDCIKTAKDPKTIKGAELKCDYCGLMLYKYAYQNRLNDLLFNQAPADIDVELEYGRLQVKIKCKVCKQINRRFIDWGWNA